MRKNLTHKQKEVLALIKDIINKNGSNPTLEEIRERLNYSNASSVQRHTDALKAKGYLRDTRGIEITENDDRVQVPLVGNVSCGMPLFAVENIEAFLLINSTLVRGNPENYFFLRAVGDSMNATSVKGKTIDPGDYVLVKKQNTAYPGERIVALLGDDATIKKYVPEAQCIKLIPESSNPANKPIIVFEDISIQGIVQDVLKGGEN